MTFPEKLDVLTVHATLIAETGGTDALRDVDGNKRVAAAVTEAFLETNGFALEMTNEEIVTFFLAIASGAFSREQVEQRLRDKVKARN